MRLTTYHHPVPLSRNLGTLTSWNPLGPSWPLTGLRYLYLYKCASFVPTVFVFRLCSDWYLLLNCRTCTMQYKSMANAFCSLKFQLARRNRQRWPWGGVGLITSVQGNIKCKGSTGCRSVPAHPPGKRETLISSGQRLKVHLHLPREHSLYYKYQLANAVEGYKRHLVWEW